MSDIECPYCGVMQEICHDDGYGYAEDETFQQECDCGKIFTFTTSISFYYDAKKADCLNGGEHDYKPTVTSPKEYTMMRCEDCVCERTPTEAEWGNIWKGE